MNVAFGLVWSSDETVDQIPITLKVNMLDYLNQIMLTKQLINNQCLQLLINREAS